MAILNAGLADLDALPDEQKDNYAIRSLIGKKAARRMLQEGQQSAYEESEKNLKEIKEDIEKKAEQAMDPTDKNGNPIEGLPTTDSGEATPMPEVSATRSSDVVDANFIPEVVTSPLVSSIPTVDIIV